jgi:adenine-specific DNA-methyltransferase
MVNTLPLPKLSAGDRKSLVAIVDRVLSTKKRQPEADVSALRREIDRLLFERYGLTDTEIAQLVA